MLDNATVLALTTPAVGTAKGGRTAGVRTDGLDWRVALDAPTRTQLVEAAGVAEGFDTVVYARLALLPQGSAAPTFAVGTRLEFVHDQQPSVTQRVEVLHRKLFAKSRERTDHWELFCKAA